MFRNVLINIPDFKDSRLFYILSRAQNTIQYNTLSYGRLRERARWVKSCAVIGYPSGQDGAFLPARDYPLPVRLASKFYSQQQCGFSSIFPLFWGKTLTKKFGKLSTFT